MLSLRDKIRSTAEAPRIKLALMGCAPPVRRCTSRGFFLLLLRTRFCAIGAEALSHQLDEVFAFLGLRCRIARERVPTNRNGKGRSLRLPHLRQKVAKPRHGPLPRDHRGSERTVG